MSAHWSARRQLAIALAIALLGAPLLQAGGKPTPAPSVGGACGVHCRPTGIYYPGVGWSNGYQPRASTCVPICTYPVYFGFTYGIAPAYPAAVYNANDPAVSGSAQTSPPSTAAASIPDPTLLPPPPVTVAPDASRALVDLNLPSDADLWVQGVRMQQAGTIRRFMSPPLDAGLNYTYEIKATWRENGREVNRVRTVSVRTGDRQSITFVAGADVAAK